MNLKLNSTHLKKIAIVAMVFDHFMAIFVSHDSVIGMLLRVPGCIAAPIMCYMIAEGYNKTSNVKKYISRLLIFALISHIPYNIAFGYSFFQATSIMWSLALGLIALTVLKHKKVHIIFKLAALFLCCALSITANWNFVAVLWIVAFGLLYKKFKMQALAFCIVSLITHIVPTFINFGFSHEVLPHWYQLGVFLAIPLLSLYNGERGNPSKCLKYGFYIFYPAHLILLFLLNKFTPLAEILESVI